MTQVAKLADGTTLNFPDDTPPEVIQRVVKQHIGKPAAPVAQQPAPSPIDQSFDQFTGGAKPALDMNAPDTVREISNTPADRFFGAVGNYADQGMLGGGDEALAGLYSLFGGDFQENLDRLQQKRGDFNSVNSTLGPTSNAAGMLLSPANAVGGEYVTSAKTLPAMVGRSSALGTTLGGTGGFLGTNGDIDKRVIGGAYGAGIGGGAGALLPFVTSFVKPNIAPDVQKLLDAGITPTPGQMAGGMLKKIEEKATSIPILGDAISGAHRRGIEQFNTAAYNDVLKPLGMKASDKIGREGVQELEDTISGEYQKILPKLTFTPDHQFVTEMSTLATNAKFMPPQQADMFEKILRDKIGTRLGASGVMDGETFKGLESELRGLAKGYQSDSSFDNRQLGDAISDALDTMRSTLLRSNPTHAPELTKINEAWARYSRIRRAAGSVGAESGVFTPAQLQAAVKAKDESVDKGRFAKGQALMQGLSDPAKNVLGNQYPNSGTAGRMIQALVTGGGLGFMSPTALATVLAASVPYTKLGGKAVAGLLSKRPAGSGLLRQMLERVTPAQGLLSGQAGAGMAGQP